MAYDGAPSAPEPSASPEIAPSTAAVSHREDPPPLYPSAARAKDCPPNSERGGLRFDARQHNVEMRLGAQRAFEPSARDAVAARRCGESARECLELAEKMRAANSSGDDSDADGYETDTSFNIDAVDDDDDDDGDEALATFSSSKTIHESDDIVRIAPFPPPPIIETEEASTVDWDSALPPRDQWPADLADLHANNPKGARTWSEVKAAMHRLVLYHAVRDTTHLYLSRRATRDAPAHAKNSTHAHACSLLADAARLAIYLHYSKSLRGKGLRATGRIAGFGPQPLPL